MIISINKRIVNNDDNDINKNYDEYCKKKESIVFLSKVVIDEKTNHGEKLIDINSRLKNLKNIYNNNIVNAYINTNINSNYYNENKNKYKERDAQKTHLLNNIKKKS